MGENKVEKFGRLGKKGLSTVLSQRGQEKVNFKAHD